MDGLPSVVRDLPTQRNFDALLALLKALEATLAALEAEGLPPSGKAGGVLKGSYPNPEFAVDMATQGELDAEKGNRESADGVLSASITTEAEARAGADSTEKTLREAADATIKGEVSTEKGLREAADAAEKSARETADGERTKGPGSSTDSDIAVYSGATGKVLKDGGKTIATVLLEAEETARALAAAAAAGLSVKNPVAYASTAALTATAEAEKTLEGNVPLTLDGKSSLWVAGTRVLLKNQASEKRNGLYEVTKVEGWGGTESWGGEETWGSGEKWLLTRTSDADTEAEVKQGMFLTVTSGTANVGTAWTLQTENPIVIGTTAQTFVQFQTSPTGVAGGDLTGTYPNPSLAAGAIVNADVNAAAGIDYSKLNLAASLVTADAAASFKAPDADKLDGINSLGFLQLAVEAGRKIALGTTSLTWSASTTAASKEITHGLGATPVIVLPVIVVAGPSRAFANAANYGATKFTLYGYAADGVLNETLNVAWIAIG